MCKPFDVLEDLLSANQSYVENFALGGLEPFAAKKVAIVTCMDTRIEPLAMLGLRPGDAKITRNAGGRVTPDVIRSLTFATRLLGVRQIAVVQHTRCALAGSSDDDLREQLGFDPGMELLGMPEPDEALLKDVEILRSSTSLAPGTIIEGWRYDVDSGRVSRIVKQ